mmetsp:Transcript_6079/g.10503  ORF Transcript_6079/g.10503 Transcript_6079/m.10503 type:complete len:83 (-) Transcript_6079:300-548(-)
MQDVQRIPDSSELQMHFSEDPGLITFVFNHEFFTLETTFNKSKVLGQPVIGKIKMLGPGTFDHFGHFLYKSVLLEPDGFPRW